MTQIKLTVNGVARSDEVEPRLLLIHYLRETLGLRAANVGCDTTSCGACTVLLDGESVKSCTVLAVQANDRSVTTTEGLVAEDGTMSAVQWPTWASGTSTCPPRRSGSGRPSAPRPPHR